MDIKKLEEKIGIEFENEKIVKNAFVHRSYLNEHPEFEMGSNERLEYLGDAVLELATSEKLYHKYPQKPEGDLTNLRAALVCTSSLATESLKLELGNYLFLSRGEEDSGGKEREYILANTFEALLGAIYLDKDYETCQRFLENSLFYKIETIVENGTYKDSKSTLQELAQEEKGITPTYKVIEDWGPDHAKNFRMGVFLTDRKIGEGTGQSKQEGEQNAAQNALEAWV